MSRELVFGSVLLALVVMVSALGNAEAGDWTFKPRAFTSAAYNDNVEEVDGGEGDYVGIVKPGVTTTYEGSQVLLDLSYDFEYKHYFNDVLDDEQNHTLAAFSKVEAIKDLFFVEVTDDYKKVYTDATKGEVASGETNQTTTDQNIFGVKPYFVIPLQERTDMTVGGEFKDIWYSESENVDKRNYAAFVDIDHELTENWKLMFGGGYEHQKPRWEDGGYERYDLSIGTQYTYSEGSFFLIRVTPTRTDYESPSDNDKNYTPYYVGITHSFTPTLVGTASSSMDFAEDPESASSLSKFVHEVGLKSEYDRGSYGFTMAYYDYEDRTATSRTTYWRPSFSGNHSMTQRISLNYNTYCDFHTNPEHDKYWFTTLALNYAVNDASKIGLSYRLKLSDSDGSQDDYTSNTLGVTFSWAY